ncbi:MAG: DUF4488 domain-containing protein [Prevotellaceae bacterium]|jgi:hypothetical protein|nr:DUF4488 domain-containing protein [Prevotellaceae bacterium]
MSCFTACKENKTTEVTSDFVGIWQLCAQRYNEEMPTIAPFEQERLPEYKIIDKDGTFTNLIVSRNTYITVFGTYDISKKDKYVELVEKSYTNPNHNRFANEMDCEMTNGKYLKLSYDTATGTRQEKVIELWIKVQKGNPFEATEN